MKKHICFISHDYPSVGNPAYVFVEQLVNALVDKGVEISVIAPQSLTKSIIRHIPVRPLKAEYHTSNGRKYNVYRPFTMTFGKGSHFLNKLVKGFNKRNVDKILKKISPDILYSHFWNNALRVLDYSLEAKLPIIVACGEGDNAIEEMVANMPETEIKKLKTAVKGVVSVSTDNKRKCIQYDLAEEKDVIVLPNAVDSTIFYPKDINFDFRHEMNVDDNDFLILFVGGFTERKGSGRLAEAIKQINDKSIKVMFVGSPMPGDVSDPDCPGIVFKGSVNHSELPKYISSADLFVLPTQKEGCCNAIVEALAMGVPVISSDGAFNDDILNANNSIRINPMDVVALKNAILKMKNDTELYNSIKSYLSNHHNNYSINLRAESIIGFITKQLS